MNVLFVNFFDLFSLTPYNYDMSRKNFNYKNKIIILALLLVTVMCFAGCGDFLSQFEETEDISSGLATVSDVMTGFVSDASSYLESEFGVGIEIEGFNDADSEAKKKIKKGVEKAKEVKENLEEEGILSDPSDIELHDVDGKGKNYAFTYGDEEFSAVYTKDNWKIVDSYKIENNEDMKIICSALIEEHQVHGRDMESYRTPDDMAYEWEQHNIAYAFLPDDNRWKAKTKDVDLNPADQGLSFTEIYEQQTGKELTIDELMKHMKEG